MKYEIDILITTVGLIIGFGFWGRAEISSGADHGGVWGENPPTMILFAPL